MWYFFRVFVSSLALFAMSCFMYVFISVCSYLCVCVFSSSCRYFFHVCRYRFIYVVRSSVSSFVRVSFARDVFLQLFLYGFRHLCIRFVFLIIDFAASFFVHVCISRCV